MKTISFTIILCLSLSICMFCKSESNIDNPICIRAISILNMKQSEIEAIGIDEIIQDLRLNLKYDRVIEIETEKVLKANEDKKAINLFIKSKVSGAIFDASFNYEGKRIYGCGFLTKGSRFIFIEL